MLSEVRTTVGRHRASTPRDSDGRAHPVQEDFRSENTPDGLRSRALCMDHPAAGPEVPSGSLGGRSQREGRVAWRHCGSIDGIRQGADGPHDRRAKTGQSGDDGSRNPAETTPHSSVATGAPGNSAATASTIACG